MSLWRPILVFLASGVFFASIAFLLRVVLQHEWHLITIETFTAVGTLTWIITEILSLFKAVTLMGLTITWGVSSLAVFVVLIRMKFENKKRITSLVNFEQHRKNMPKGLLVALTYTGVIIFILGITAFIAAPNTYDSMAYHLSRVMYWQQNHSLAFYPTYDLRQNSFGSMAEMAILNFQILAGGDRLANMVQFTSMLGCLIGVSLITELLGGDRYARIFAVLATITIPMGILQSTSTQNDYMLGLWVICFVVFLLTQIQQGYSLQLCLWAGLSLGLAINTKYIAVIFVGPIGLWFAINLWRCKKAKAFGMLIILLVSAMIMIAPLGLRNFTLFSSVFGEDYHLTNDIYNPAVFLSNSVRNLSLHLATPIPTLNVFFEQAVLKIHALIGLDASDPRTTWGGTKFHVLFTSFEELAGNPLHILLIIIAIPLAFNSRKKNLFLYAVCLVAACSLFSLLLKWQPWHSRLQLPLFIFAMPYVAVALTEFMSRWHIYLIMFLLFFLAPPYLFMNPSRPLLGQDSILIKDRVDQYFLLTPELLTPYKKVTSTIDNLGCNQIGLISYFGGTEYPIWVLLRSRDKDTHMEHILVGNESKKLSNNFFPCAILVLHPGVEQEIFYRNHRFIKNFDDEGICLYLPK